MHFYCNIHDLYKEWAEHEIKLNAASRSCVYKGEKTLPRCLMSNPQGHIGRIWWTSNCRHHIQLHWKMKSCKSGPSAGIVCACWHLDIQPLKQLCSLGVFCQQLISLTGTKDMEQLSCVELECPPLKIHELKFNNCGTLEVFHLKEVHPPSRPSHYSITPLWFNIPTIPRKMLVLQQSRCILILKIVGNQSIYQALVEQWTFGIAGLAALTNLCKLKLTHVHMRSLAKLQKRSSLEILDLLKMSSTQKCAS